MSVAAVGRDRFLFHLLGLSLLLLGAGSLAFMAGLVRSFGVTPMSVIAVPASLLAAAAGIAAIVAGRRGVAGDHLVALAQALGVARRGAWRLAVGALLLLCGLALVATGCAATQGPWVPRSWPPESIDVGIMLFWLGVTLAGIVSIWLALRLFRAPRPL